MDNKSPLKGLENVARHMFAGAQGVEFNAEFLTPTAKGGGGKIQVYRCLTAISVGHIYHMESFLHQNIYE